MTNSNPYRNIGIRLRKLRETAGEAVGDVASAIELSEEEVKAFEQGATKPSEDILLLLINHYDLNDEDALRLWELADYDGDIEPVASEHKQKSQGMMIVMPLDMRVNYTDMVQVNVNDFGVVVNFMQALAPNSQAVPIARVGMSLEYAETVIAVLTETLQKARHSKQPKQLPSSEG